MTGSPEKVWSDAPDAAAGVALLQRFFALTGRQQSCFEALGSLYAEWNAKINVISRKDMGNFYARHVLHSLAIAKVVSFLPGSRVVDVGTGGGFPGIPLAILFPDTEFTLVDSIAKKIKVVEAVKNALGLTNVHPVWGRAENLHARFDFAVSRAVCAMPEFHAYVKNLISPTHHHPLRNGILYLKGGDLTDELRPFAGKIHEYPITRLFDLEGELFDFYETKKVIHLEF
ncbi:MAG: 16S rRNA (guanine(527)-N(7))-methyltransferase RsmG [Bacteroidales bacterium]|nr:16S rRNA (guanine(527)-N(7))-methyltransferase RsmG [Bacteroidales bacterium]